MRVVVVRMNQCPRVVATMKHDDAVISRRRRRRRCCNNSSSRRWNCNKNTKNNNSEEYHHHHCYYHCVTRQRLSSTHSITDNDDDDDDHHRNDDHSEFQTSPRFTMTTTTTTALQQEQQMTATTGDHRTITLRQQQQQQQQQVDRNSMVVVVGVGSGCRRRRRRRCCCVMDRYKRLVIAALLVVLVVMVVVVVNEINIPQLQLGVPVSSLSVPQYRRLARLLHDNSIIQIRRLQQQQQQQQYHQRSLAATRRFVTPLSTTTTASSRNSRQQDPWSTIATTTIPMVSTTTMRRMKLPNRQSLQRSPSQPSTICCYVGTTSSSHHYSDNHSDDVISTGSNTTNVSTTIMNNKKSTKTTNTTIIGNSTGGPLRQQLLPPPPPPPPPPTSTSTTTVQRGQPPLYIRRTIPPTELQVQQLKQLRQEAYEKICGTTESDEEDDGDESGDDSITSTNSDLSSVRSLTKKTNTTATADVTDDCSSPTILIDTGATYNATKEYVQLDSSTITATTTCEIDKNTNTGTDATAVTTSSPIVVLENVYVQLDTSTNRTTITTTTTNTTTGSLQQQRKTKKKNLLKPPPSIWSFENLFPAPVWDTESIEKDLYRTTNATSNISNNTMSKNIANPQLQQQTSDSLNLMKNVVVDDTTFLYGGSGVVRKERKSSFNNNNQQRPPPTPNRNSGNSTMSTTTNNNNNSTGKVDPLLTRMVEDRVYGYRRLPTGVLQYETSLVGRDTAIQFRNGVRLGNPLPINADLLSYLAKKELQHGRIEEACELYERAVTIDPADGRAYLGLSKCAERRRDFTLARKWLIQGINRSVSVQTQQPQQNLPSTTQQQRSRTGGDSSSKTNNNKSNRNDNDERYVEAATLIPDRGANPFLLQALGCLEEKMGRLTQAETCFTEAVKSRPYHTAAWVSLAVLRTRKLGYPVRAGRECYQCAERELQVAQQSPSSYIYTSWANLEYHKANDKNRARELFQKAIQIDPQCSAAWLQLGVLEAACENWDAAELCFDTVLKFDQRNTRILQAYAIMETKRPSGDSRKAIGLFERAVQINPRDAGVYQPYALYVAELGDMNMARLLLQKGTQVNKRHAAVWQAWGVLETRYGDADAARKIFQEGIWACGQLSGSQSGGYQCDRLWQAWGVLEANEEQYAAARRCFNRALDANNRNVPAFTAWALMEEQLCNINDARMIFERGLRKFSTGSEDKKALYRSYELMEQRLGDTTAAQNIYQRSVRESFSEKDEIESFKTSVLISTVDNNMENFGNDGNISQQEEVKKKTKEFEVVRWENTGGEVWLNDRSIEAKVPIFKKSISSRDGNNKSKKRSTSAGSTKP